MSKLHNLRVNQGADFSFSLTILEDSGVVKNLNGASVESDIRKHHTANSSLSFTTSINTETSVVTLSLTANQTFELSEGKYVYDAILTDSDENVTRIVEGLLFLRPSVTR